MSEKRPPEYYLGYGELLRSYRLAMSLSLRGMAEKLDMSERSWSSMEQNRNACPPGMIDVVSELVTQFDAAVETLIELAEARGATADNPMHIPVDYEPGDPWERAVIGRAAVDSGIILPITDGLPPEFEPRWDRPRAEQR